MKKHEVTDQDRADLAVAVEAAGVEAAPDALIVRSDVWPRVEGHCDWAMSVPDRDLAAEGRADDLASAQKAMDAQLLEWFPELAEEQPDGAFLVQRVVP